MSKPGDVSQEAWDAAKKVWFEMPPLQKWETVVTLYARAIMAAQSGERQAIAEWADATADHYDAKSIIDAIGDVVPNRAAEKALRGFAEAIRTRP